MPLSLLVLSSVAPVAAKADSWGSKEQNVLYDLNNKKVMNQISDKILETMAATNEQNIINYINSEVSYINSDNDPKYLPSKNDNLSALSRYKQEAQDAYNNYVSKSNGASDKFTGTGSYVTDYFDSGRDVMFITNYTGTHTDYRADLEDSVVNSNIDYNSLEMLLDDYNSKKIEQTNPGDIVPNTTQVQSMISSAVSSNNNNDSDAKAIASLQAEVAKLEKEVSGQKKSSSHAKTLAADKKQLAKINKELHQKHLGKKAHHKLVLQRKALLKAIKKLVK